MDKGETAIGAEVDDDLKTEETAIGAEADDDLKTEEKLRERNEMNINVLVNYIRAKPCKKIIVMVGKGISTYKFPGVKTGENIDFTAGTEGTSASNNMPDIDELLDIDFFKKDPKPFFKFFKDMFACKLVPTTCHYFLKLLHDKGLLLRLYTQNIDTLERVVGIPHEKIVETNGTFYTSHCMNRTCRKEYDINWIKEIVSADKVPMCPDCGQVIKPDINFYGDNIPRRLSIAIQEDFSQADLLIFMGAYLNVEPMTSIVHMIPNAITTFVIAKLQYHEVKECDTEFYLNLGSSSNPELIKDVQKLIADNGLDKNTVGKILISRPPKSWSVEVLREIFGRHGDVKICEKLGGYILVVMASSDEAQAAIAAWNKSEYLDAKILLEYPVVSHGEHNLPVDDPVVPQGECDLPIDDPGVYEGGRYLPINNPVLDVVGDQPGYVVPSAPYEMIETVPDDIVERTYYEDLPASVERETYSGFYFDSPPSSGRPGPSHESVEDRKDSEIGSMTLCDLPRSVSVEQLGEFFEKFGVLERCEQIEDHVELKMASDDERLAAIEAWNKSEILGVKIVHKDQLDSEYEDDLLPQMRCDMIWHGACEDACYALAAALEWDEELKNMVAVGLDSGSSSTPVTSEKEKNITPKEV